MTLIELIMACAILMILASAALPAMRVKLKSDKEAELRRDLREMRDAIDHYKDAADAGKFQTKVDSDNYPPDLQTLVDGVTLSGAAGHKLRFLRQIPKDPMTGTKDWGLRSTQDDLDSTSWGGQNVFDVFTKSQGTALDGTKYTDW
jgi:general secretion pathway protein G